MPTLQELIETEPTEPQINRRSLTTIKGILAMEQMVNCFPHLHAHVTPLDHTNLMVMQIIVRILPKAAVHVKKETLSRALPSKYPSKEKN